MFKIRRGLGRTVLAAALLALPACDVSDPLEGVDLILDVEDAPVALNASINVVPGQETETVLSVTKDASIKSVEDIETITLDPSALTFTALPGLRSQSMSGPDATGKINVKITIGTGEDAFRTNFVVGILNNVVVSVKPSKLLDLNNFEAWKGEVLAAVNELDPEDRPDVSDIQALEAEPVRRGMVRIFNLGSTQIRIVVRADVGGILRLGQIDLGGRFRF